MERGVDGAAAFICYEGKGRKNPPYPSPAQPSSRMGRLKPAQMYATQVWFFSPATATRVMEGHVPPYPRPAQPSPHTGTIEAGAVATWNFHRRSPSAPARLSLHTITTVRLPLQPGSATYHYRDPPSDPARPSHARLSGPASSPVRVATRCCHRHSADQFRCELPLVAATARSRLRFSTSTSRSDNVPT